MMKLALGLVFMLGMGTAAQAGAIEKACNVSDRSAASRELCNCIGKAADATLSGPDQRRAAKFFKDPQKAQDARQSDSPSMEAFWLRYKEFGKVAEAWCTPQPQVVPDGES